MASRVDFPTVLVGAALLLTCTVGALGSARAGGDARAHDEAGDARLRDELAEHGWVTFEGMPAASPSPSARSLANGVEMLRPARAFALHLDNGVVEGDAAEPLALAHARAIVTTELSRYSPRFLQRAGLARVLFTSSLRERGRPIPSLPNCTGTLLLDVDAPDAFLRRLVHHEIFHFALGMATRRSKALTSTRGRTAMALWRKNAKRPVF